VYTHYVPVLYLATLCCSQEHDPPVIKDITEDGQHFERCFRGSEFAQFCHKTFPRRYADPLHGIGYGQALMGGDGMIVALTGVRCAHNIAWCPAVSADHLHLSCSARTSLSGTASTNSRKTLPRRSP